MSPAAPVFADRDLPLWAAARPFLDVRDNDTHTIVAYGLARALLAELPEAEEAIVLPAILLHDVGWKRIDPDLLLDAVGRNPTRRGITRSTGSPSRGTFWSGTGPRASTSTRSSRSSTGTTRPGRPGRSTTRW